MPLGKKKKLNNYIKNKSDLGKYPNVAFYLSCFYLADGLGHAAHRTEHTPCARFEQFHGFFQRACARSQIGLEEHIKKKEFCLLYLFYTAITCDFLLPGDK